MTILNLERVEDTRTAWPMIKRYVESSGISYPAAAAANTSIPDAAVLTKQELDEGVELAKMEVVLRKIAIVGIIRAIQTNTMSSFASTILYRSFKDPAVTQKLHTTAKTLMMSAPFALTYEGIRRRIAASVTTQNGVTAVNNSPSMTGKGLSALPHLGSLAAQSIKNTVNEFKDAIVGPAVGVVTEDGKSSHARGNGNLGSPSIIEL